MAEDLSSRRPPLGKKDRRAARRGLIDVRVLKEVLSSQGIRGAVFHCEVCNERHYLDWDLIVTNLKELVETGTTAIHEPAYAPNPDEYVSWEYARGLLDGYESFAAVPNELSVHVVLSVADEDLNEVEER